MTFYKTADNASANKSAALTPSSKTMSSMQTDKPDNHTGIIDRCIRAALSNSPILPFERCYFIP
ncbi:hypothetical protein BGZ73_003655 [Actinomortierella ambigua]|nr:hypothetical protein BGZ73_003655 [Actinomortierella ambigua]